MPVNLHQELYVVPDVRVVWTIRGVRMPVNASECQLTMADNYDAPALLSGDVIVNRAREYAEAGRSSTILDPPRKIQLTFPDLPTSVYHFCRMRRTFPRPFNIEIRLLDSLDFEPLFTPERTYYYGALGGWKPGSLVLRINGVETDPVGLVKVNWRWGILQFLIPRATEDRIEVRYVWAPTVMNMDKVAPTFRLKTADRQARVQITLLEIRPSHDDAAQWDDLS